MPPWEIKPGSPVIVPGQLNRPYDDTRAGAAHVIQLGDRYRMVYWGSDGAGKNYILQAETPVSKPNDWRAVGGGPLLGPQEASRLNCVGPSFPFLLPVTESRWLLYFTGWGYREDGKLPNTTGVAVSDDAGESWRYHDQQPVIPLDRDYDREGTGSVWVLLEGGRFRMYYTALGEYFARPPGVKTGHGELIPRIGIAYAESADGIHWEKPFADLLVKPRGFEVEPYEYICSKPCIVKSDSGYILWVNTFGTAYRVHRLSSADGLNWTWEERIGPDGELGIGNKGSFDDHQRSYPTIVKHDTEFRCWYTGNNFGAAGMGYAVAPEVS